MIQFSYSFAYYQYIAVMYYQYYAKTVESIINALYRISLCPTQIREKIIFIIIVNFLSNSVCPVA